MPRSQVIAWLVPTSPHAAESHRPALPGRRNRHSGLVVRGTRPRLGIEQRRSLSEKPERLRCQPFSRNLWSDETRQVRGPNPRKVSLRLGCPKVEKLLTGCVLASAAPSSRNDHQPLTIVTAVSTPRSAFLRELLDDVSRSQVGLTPPLLLRPTTRIFPPRAAPACQASGWIHRDAVGNQSADFPRSLPPRKSGNQPGRSRSVVHPTR
jgi:hypothetical protein